MPDSAIRRKWFSVSIWVILFAFAIFTHFLPSLTKPKRTPSERRPVPIAIRQADDADAIKAEVAALLAEIEERWFDDYQRPPFNRYYERKSRLAGPSPPEAIEKLASLVGPLPLDFRAYLELHNGQHHGGSTGIVSVFLSDCETIYVSSQDLVGIYAENVLPPTLPEAGLWAHPGTLLFADSDGAGLAVNASSGVIYSWDHDGGELTKVTDSFLDFLRIAAEEMRDVTDPPHRLY